MSNIQEFDFPRRLASISIGGVPGVSKDHICEIVERTMELYLSRPLEPSTLNAYRHKLRGLWVVRKDAPEGVSLKQQWHALTVRAIEHMQPNTISYAKSIIAAIQGYLSWLYDMEVLPTEVDLKIDFNGKIEEALRVAKVRKKKRERLITDDQFVKLLSGISTVKNTRVRYRDYACFVLMYNLGLRCRDVTRMKRKDVYKVDNPRSEDKEYAVIVCGKEEIKRQEASIIYISKELYEAVHQAWDHIGLHDDGYIAFPADNRHKVGSEPLSYQGLLHALNRYKRKGVLHKEFTPHDFRRSIATNMMQAGVSKEYVKHTLRMSEDVFDRHYNMYAHERTNGNRVIM